MDLKTPNADSYQVGWVCAVKIEYIVACELLDEEFGPPHLRSTDDNNIYTCGRMGDFHVVIACLPKGRYGLTSAATVAQDLRHSFPSISFGLMVGIGGGAPVISKNRDIRLGDVVVSTPTGRSGGVIHYEFGKTVQNKAFAPFGHLNAPPRVLLTAVQKLDTVHYRRGNRIQETIMQVIEKNPRLKSDYCQPSTEMDILFRSSYLHQDDSRLCSDCCSPISDNIVSRHPRTQELVADQGDTIRIHYGLIASADRLMKDATVRDQLTETEGVLCFEMEAAGLMDCFPCLVIRGICDYSDTHKNDAWQGYAAATAAAYAKELLAVMPKRAVTQQPTETGVLRESVHMHQGDVQGRLSHTTTSSKHREDGPRRQGTRLISTLRTIGFDRTAYLPTSFIMAIENIFSQRDIESLYLELRLGSSQHFPYFFAGSLMFPSTIRAITSGISLRYIVSTMTVATLHGYKRHAVKGSPWPAFSPSNDPRDEVTGLACFGINESQRQRIHDFQGGMFDLRRATIDIELADGDIMPFKAELFVWNQSPDHLIPTDVVLWNPDTMLQDDWIQDILKETRDEETSLENNGFRPLPKG